VKYTDADSGQALNYFHQAIEIEPDYADAHAALATALLDRAIWGRSSVPDVEANVREAATTAMRIDPGNANAHVAMSILLNFYDHDWTGAEQEAKRALEIDANNVDALMAYSWLLQSLGRDAEVRNNMERAIQLDPASSNVHSSYGRMLYRARN